MSGNTFILNVRRNVHTPLLLYTTISFNESISKQQYLGRWYQYSAYWNIYGIGATCTNAIYSDGTDENGKFRVRVNNMGLDR